MKKSWSDSLPNFSTKQLISIGSILVAIAIYFTSKSPLMYLAGGFGILTFFASKSDTDNLTMREVIEVFNEEVRDRQNRHELPTGDVELQDDDIGMQYIFFV